MATAPEQVRLASDIHSLGVDGDVARAADERRSHVCVRPLWFRRQRHPDAVVLALVGLNASVIHDVCGLPSPGVASDIRRPEAMPVAPQCVRAGTEGGPEVAPIHQVLTGSHLDPGPRPEGVKGTVRSAHHARVREVALQHRIRERPRHRQCGGVGSEGRDHPARRRQNYQRLNPPCDGVDVPAQSCLARPRQPLRGVLRPIEVTSELVQLLAYSSYS